jgi:hypothetical protein
MVRHEKALDFGGCNSRPPFICPDSCSAGPAIKSQLFSTFDFGPAQRSDLPIRYNHLGWNGTSGFSIVMNS